MVSIAPSYHHEAESNMPSKSRVGVDSKDSAILRLCSNRPSRWLRRQKKVCGSVIWAIRVLHFSCDVRVIGSEWWRVHHVQRLLLKRRITRRVPSRDHCFVRDILPALAARSGPDYLPAFDML